MRPLPWFPPAPAAGDSGILSLPPDDWVMQPDAASVADYCEQNGDLIRDPEIVFEVNCYHQNSVRK
jgi:hypothetical protein